MPIQMCEFVQMIKVKVYLTEIGYGLDPTGLGKSPMGGFLDLDIENLGSHIGKI